MGLVSSPAFLAIYLAIIIFLPFPFSEINILASALVLALLITNSGGVVWWSLALYFVFDWYTVGPFGVVLFAGVLTTLMLVWMYRSLLTNRGVWSAALLTIFFIFLFRILYTIIFLLVAHGNWTSTPPVLSGIFVEMSITTLFVSLVYVLLSRLIPVLKVTHTHHRTSYVRD